MKGRPVGSEVRQNLIEILAVVGKAYGYQLAKLYLEVFPATTKRNIYYHLKKGVELGELQVFDIFHEEGEYSWGTVAEKIYYELGPKAQVKGDERVTQAIRNIKEH